MLQWLWRKPAATGLIQPLAWEPPYATGVALKRQKPKKKKKTKKKKKKKKKEKEKKERTMETAVIVRYPVYINR